MRPDLHTTAPATLTEETTMSTADTTAALAAEILQGATTGRDLALDENEWGVR